MSQKALKGKFPEPEKLENHSNEEKGKEKKKERGEEKKNNGCTISFYNSYFGDGFWPKENCWTQKVHLAITLSKIRIADYNCTRNSNIFKNISLSN